MACPYLSFLETNLFKCLHLWAVLFCPSVTGQDRTPLLLCGFSFTIGRLKQKYKIPLDDSRQKMKSELIRETQRQRPAWTLKCTYIYTDMHVHKEHTFLCSSKNKHLSCFHVLALGNNAYSIFLCLLSIMKIDSSLSIFN